MVGHVTTEPLVNAHHEPDGTDEINRLQIAVVVAGHTGDEQFARSHVHHPVGRIRASALNALERLGVLEDDVLAASTHDPDPAVRRRVAEIAARHVDVDLLSLLDDDEPLVVEMAAWACGEQMQADDDSHTTSAPIDDTTRHARVVDRLMDLAVGDDDALVRESCVAALGAIGDERALPAILAGCADKPAVRRRAVLALAPFSGPEVDAALYRALEDRDWQVRQAAEDVLGPDAASTRETLDDEQHTEEDEEH